MCKVLSVSRLAVFYDIFYAFFVFVVLISYVCGMENKKDRWFRIKEGVDALTGHKVGGVYKVKSVVGKHTLTLYVDGGGYWFYGINDLEEVFEEDELVGWSGVDKFKVGEDVYYFDPEEDAVCKGYFLRESTEVENKYLRSYNKYQVANLAGNLVSVDMIYRENELLMSDESFYVLLNHFLRSRNLNDLRELKIKKLSDSQVGILVVRIITDGDLKVAVLDKVLNLISTYQLRFNK